MDNPICPKCGKPKIGYFADATGSAYAIEVCTCGFVPSSKEVDIQKLDFESFTKCLELAYKSFCLNKELRNKITKSYNNLKTLWDTLIKALEIDYKLWLAKLLDNNDAPDCVKGLLKEENEDINKLKSWRDDFLAHFNEKTFREWGDFITKNELKEEFFENIFNRIIKAASEYSVKMGWSLNLEESSKRIKEETEKEAQVLSEKIDSDI